jgi:histone H3/H4
METPRGNLSQVMQHINGAYTNYFNAKRKRSGHLFQGRYKAILIEADAYAMELSRYVHLNPVKAGVSAMPDEYRWSSYRDYVGLRETPTWLATAFILALLGASGEAAQKSYRKFVEDVVGKEVESPLEGAVAATILGRDDFVAEIQERHVDTRSADRNLSALRQLAHRPTIDRIIKAAAVEFSGNERLAEKAAVYLCHRYSGAKLREIGERFGVKDSAVSQSSRRFKAELDGDKQLRNIVEKLKEKLALSNV